MQQLLRSVLALVAALWLALAVVPASAQPANSLTLQSEGSEPASRSLTLLPGIDLPGFDYEVLKDSSLEACEAACLDDRVCRAFTFNQQAGWCFLKGEAGPEAVFPAATSGRVTLVPNSEATEALRQDDLPFPAEAFLESARTLAAQLKQTDPPPPGLAYADLVAAGDAALAQSNGAGAMVSYRQALAVVDNDPALWLKLSRVARSRAEAEEAAGNSSYELAVLATSAAVNALLQSESLAERATALQALADGLAQRAMWREAIASYRASLALVPNARMQARLEAVVAEHGFRVVSHEVDAEAAAPRICAVFSEELPSGSADLSNYVSVESAPQVAVETEQNQICLTGLEHGRRYAFRLRPGLPAASGETLRKEVALDVYVPDRSPFVGFANNAYVMPSGLGGGLPITSVNTDSADLAFYRIGDRSIATAVRNGIFQGTLDGYRAEDVANQFGEKLWEGTIELSGGAANSLVTTAVPVAEVLADAEPGAYVVTAKVAGVETEYWREIATQWFIVTDLGLTTVSGEDGVHAFVRRLGSAEPVANALVRLVAVNNDVLGEARTDARGRADFAPGLARGEGGRAPQLLVVETESGDYAFLDVARPAFDLTDRGVEGRPSPGPLDLFATTERGVYRPGESVFLTALLRDRQASAVAGLPLTLRLERPDGVLAEQQLLSDAGAGGYFAELPLNHDAMRGSWHIRLYADPKAEALSDVAFLVEDFEPERLAFEVSTPEGPVAAETVIPVAVTARYLYGATAPGLAVEADAVLRPVTTLRNYPGYVFGRVDDTLETSRQPLGIVGTTDENGSATAEVTLSAPQVSTRPLEAQLILRLVDTNGRPVERSLTRPVLAATDRIGIKPGFGADGMVEGSEAAFDIIAVAPSGERVSRSNLAWTLSQIETSYQWYRDNGTWKWEAITSARVVANGEIDALAGAPVTVALPVEWGRYQFEVSSSGQGATSSSVEFYAGYHYVEAGSDTPDTLQVALDRPSYRSGETATLKLDPQFAGTALVMVVDDRLIDMVAVPVPAEGTTVPLRVTDDWGPGAYVTAVLYRPASAIEKRMPARALGVAFAAVDAGRRRLDLDVEAPTETLPRRPLTVRVALDKAAAGDRAFVSVAAVDLGILNLTSFRTPDPDGWFFGQRQLGVELRDLYGSLIDPTQGAPGALRVGGDGGGATRLGTPPPTSVLVAQHSGIVEVGPDGTATVTFEMPDFAGTVRLMAMAWTDEAVGHAQHDVVVRDPVVVTLSPPRFLRLDDQSRLLVEINNVAGPAGTYELAVTAGPGVAVSTGELSVDLATGARAGLEFKLTGAAIGDHELSLAVTGPNGDVLRKELTLGVRAASIARTYSELIPIAAGATATLTGSRFDGMVAESGSLTLAIGPLARLDVPNLLLQLDRYPYGCAEQVASRAMPLLYLNDVAEAIGLGTDETLHQRVRDAVADLLAKQNSSGGFGLWGPFSNSDLWLDSYVTEFLLRARTAGYEIPERGLAMALDNLGNQVAYAADFTTGGEDIAYALYNLARAGRAAIGDLRYYLEARLDALATPLAKAQLGAALALYGDRDRAVTAFRAAVDDLAVPEDRDRYRNDYGSLLRDTAAVLALAAEFAPQAVDITALTSELARQRSVEDYTSTQEDAWTLIASGSLARDTADGSVAIDRVALTGPVYQRFEQEHFDTRSVTLTNNGARPIEARVSVTAIPELPPPAESQGFTINRTYYLPDGSPADLDRVSQNDRFVVVLNMAATALGSGQYLVVDPLPAGFEIENPDLSAAAGVADLNWLSLNTPSHVEARTDRFVAAFNYASGTPSFSTAYMVRAVSPGLFVLPGASVEDMYRPEKRANTDAGAVEVIATGR